MQTYIDIFFKSPRTSLAYISAIILLAGVCVLILKTLLGTRNLEKRQERISLIFQKIWRKYQKLLPLFYFFLVIIGLIHFRLFPFPLAFALAAALMIYLSLKLKRRTLFTLAFITIFIFWSIYLLQQQDSHIKIFDNLDSHITHTKVLAESGKVFSLNPETRLDNYINGLPFSGAELGFNVLTWLYILFPPFTAYILNDLLIRVVAFLGMILLLKKHIIIPVQKKEDWILIGSSLCFSLLPFYSIGGISTAGIPLLLYSFLNLRNREAKISNFLIIFSFPFYSKLALVGVFIILILFLFFVFDGLKERKINLLFIGGLALLIATYIFTHFHLIYSFLNPDFISHRQEIAAQAVSTSEALKRTVWNFIFDRVNVVGAHHIFVLEAAALAIVLSVVKNQKAKRLALLVLAALLTSIMWGFKYWGGFMSLRDKISFLNTFDVARFYWFNPFIWYLIFTFSLLTIARIKHGRIIVSYLISLQILFMFSHYNWEYRSLLGINKSFAGSRLTYSLTYRGFYSESLFENIQKHIKIPQKDYRVICIGIHPAIANYNGFYTLDIYTDVYPLEYKHQFRRIIEKELEKSQPLRQVFDSNAKRCYLLASELHGIKEIRGLAFTRGITKEDQHLKIKSLNLNTPALKEMGGEYIFSGVEILNFGENGLSFERIFESEDSPWKIFLYRVI